MRCRRASACALLVHVGRIEKKQRQWQPQTVKTLEPQMEATSRVSCLLLEPSDATMELCKFNASWVLGSDSHVAHHILPPSSRRTMRWSVSLATACRRRDRGQHADPATIRTYCGDMTILSVNDAHLGRRGVQP